MCVGGSFRVDYIIFLPDFQDPNKRKSTRVPVSGTRVLSLCPCTAEPQKCGAPFWCRKRESNPYDTLASRDFKSRASASSAIPAKWNRSIILFLCAFVNTVRKNPAGGACTQSSRFIHRRVGSSPGDFALCRSKIQYLLKKSPRTG